jgi:FkbM family methyltransferase
VSELISFLESAKRAGVPLSTVYDIGAHRGEWSREVRAAVGGDTEFILFEANPNLVPDLDASGFRYYVAALSSPDRGHVDFHRRGIAGTGDSYYRETTSCYDDTEIVRLPATTLDNLMTNLDLPFPDFIKLDTQGSELDILAGGEAALARASLVLVECPIIRYNAGAPSLQDYLDFFRRRHFIPVRLVETHYGEGTLLQVDIMFASEAAKSQLSGPNSVIRPFFGRPSTQ